MIVHCGAVATDPEDVFWPGAQSKFKPVKFTCRQRGAVLTALYQAIGAARGCPISRKVLLWRQLAACYHEFAVVPAASRAMLI